MEIEDILELDFELFKRILIEKVYWFDYISFSYLCTISDFINNIFL